MLSHEAVRGSRPESRERSSFMSRYPALQSPGREADEDGMRNSWAGAHGGGGIIRPSTSESMLHRPGTSGSMGFICTDLSDMRAVADGRELAGSLSPEQHELHNLSFDYPPEPERGGNVYHGKGHGGRSEMFWNRLSSYYSADDHPVRAQTPGLPESPKHRRVGTPELTHHADLDER